MGVEDQPTDIVPYTPHEWDRLTAFANITDRIHSLPTRLQALQPGERMMYSDDSTGNRGFAFEVTQAHIQILARTAWNLYQSEFVPDSRMKVLADKIMQNTKERYAEQDSLQHHPLSDLWNNS